MRDLVAQHSAIAFQIFFATLWMTITTILSELSGWFRLMARFPDRPAEPVLRLRLQSGMLGLVSLGGIMTLAVCQPGLRVSMWRIFGPFNRPFLVPWTEIAVEQRAERGVLFPPRAALRFGAPVVGMLLLSANVADRLARAAQDQWPEPGPFPQEPLGTDVRRRVRQWALVTSVAAIFFTSVSWAVMPKDARAPLLVVAVLWPAILCGLTMLVRFFAERG